MRKTVTVLCVLLSALTLFAGTRLDSEKPEAPYDAICYGLFDNQSLTVTSTARFGDKAYPVGETSGKWSVYIPEFFQPKNSLVIILIPDGISAYDFARSETGKAWIGKADETQDFAVAFIEAEDAGTWNVKEEKGKRDEAAFLRAAFVALRNKDELVNAFISVDKNCVSLVGYEEGAVAAAIAASAWPQHFSNLTLVSPTSYEGETIEFWLSQGIFPYATDNLNGYDPDYKAGMVAMPLYVYPGEDKAVAEAYLEKWAEINRNAVNPDTSREKDLEVSKRLQRSDVNTLYEGISANGRFMGYPGGTIRSTFGRYDGRKLTQVEEYIDGYLRRYFVYTPDRYYSQGGPVPLVLCMHGSSASTYDIPEESRWMDVADEYGFIVAFPQGYMATVAAKNPIPAWYSLPTEDGTKTDVDFLARIVKEVSKEWDIDPERVYLTGHSMGSMMTQKTAVSDKGTIFAAFGPVGYALNAGAENADGRVLPMNFFKGQYDLTGNDIISDETEKDAFDYWGAYHGIAARDEGTKTERINKDIGKFVTTSFSINKVPVVSYTQVSSSPHVYMPEEAELLWDFFSHWTRGADGTSYYDGEPVEL